MLKPKIGHRLRCNNYSTGRIHVGCLYDDHMFWYKGRNFARGIIRRYRSIYVYIGTIERKTAEIYSNASVSCHYVAEAQLRQQELFVQGEKKYNVAKAVDKITERWGVHSDALNSLKP